MEEKSTCNFKLYMNCFQYRRKKGKGELVKMKKETRIKEEEKFMCN